MTHTDKERNKYSRRKHQMKKEAKSEFGKTAGIKTTIRTFQLTPS
jgi:hypothetical protein